jgi:hypothetical protein
LKDEDSRLVDIVIAAKPSRNQCVGYHLRGQNAELNLGAVLALQHEIEMPDLDSKTINYSTLHQFLSVPPIPA